MLLSNPANGLEYGCAAPQQNLGSIHGDLDERVHGDGFGNRNAHVAVQLLAFGWLRREAGIARTLLVLPLGTAAALAVLLGSGGVAAFALVWAMLRLGGASIDEPARRYLYDLFPVELRAMFKFISYTQPEQAGL